MMTGRGKGAVCTLVLCWVCAAGVGVGQEGDTLLRFREWYDSEVARIGKAGEGSLAALGAEYTRSLAALEKTFQAQGKLEPLLAAKKERERFAADPVVAAQHLSNESVELRAVQEKYRKDVESLPAKKAQEIVALVQRYDLSLKNLQESLTKNGRIQDAVLVKKEREGMEERPEVKNARFVLADLESRQPPAAPAVPAGPSVPAAVVKPVTPGTPPAAAKKKYVGNDQNQIRRRYDDLCKVLLQQEMDKAAEYVDPEFVKEHGAGEVRARLSQTLPFLRFTQSPGVKLDAGDVKMAADGQSATLIPRVWGYNQWHDMNAINWLLKEGDWYLDMSAAGAATPVPAAPARHAWPRRPRR